MQCIFRLSCDFKVLQRAMLLIMNQSVSYVPHTYTVSIAPSVIQVSLSNKPNTITFTTEGIFIKCYRKFNFNTYASNYLTKLMTVTH